MGGEERGWVIYAGAVGRDVRAVARARVVVRRRASRSRRGAGAAGAGRPRRGWDGVRCGKSCAPPVPTWGPRCPRPCGRTSARWTRAPRWCRSPGGRTTTSTCRPVWRRGWPSPGGEYEVVGVTAFQNREFGLADFLDETGPVDPWGPRPGNVATVNVPCGPDSAVRACVACADLPRRRGRGRAALLLRGPGAHGMHPEVTLEVVVDRAGGGRRDRRRGTAVSVASTTSFAVRCCPSEARCSARTAAC